ncbi:hypothetical protein PPM_p0294 (plasmid) [Paenibacillus polymyxa M1]|nr:hypothetical protein PPM_p0294 [Paenibacillus polymyxa M1]
MLYDATCHTTSFHVRYRYYSTYVRYSDKEERFIPHLQRMGVFSLNIDKALYTAKNTGRNKVVNFMDLMDLDEDPDLAVRVTSQV